MKRLLKAWIFGLGLSLIWVPSVMARNGVYTGEANQIVDKVTGILIANGYCKNTYDCQTKEYEFTSGSDDGIYASFYKINDAKTINKIVALYTAVYFEHKQKIDIEVTFDRFSNKDDRWYKESYIQLKLKGVEK